MPTFKSKPHKIEAFQFIGYGTEYPQWFLDLRTVGKASITLDSRKAGDFIMLYNDDGDTQRVLPSQWVARNSTETVFKIKDNEITEGFDLDE